MTIRWDWPITVDQHWSQDLTLILIALLEPKFTILKPINGMMPPIIPLARKFVFIFFEIA